MCGALSRVALIRGRRLSTLPLHVRCFVKGGAYSRATFIYFSAPCAALNRGWPLFGMSNLVLIRTLHNNSNVGKVDDPS